LKVAVHEVSGMKRCESVRHVRTDPNRGVRGQRPGPQTVGERLPFKQFHDDEGSTTAAHAAWFTVVVDAGDVGMVQPRQRPSFGQQAPAGRGVVRVSGSQHFDHHRPVQRLVIRTPEDGGIGFAKLFDEPISTPE